MPLTDTTGADYQDRFHLLIVSPIDRPKIPLIQGTFIDYIADFFILSPMDVIFHGSGPYPSGTKIGPAYWAHLDLIIVTKGSANLIIGRKSFVLSEGDAIVIPPNTKFQGEGTQDNTAIWVLHYNVTNPLKRAKIHAQTVTGSFSRELLSEISQAYQYLPRDNPYLNALANTLIERLSAAATLSRPSDLRHDHLLPQGSLPQRVRDMAHTIGFSASHYRAKFRQTTGITPRQYLKDLKAEKARALLRDTRLPIKEIAVLVGYKDVVSFHRAFTAFSGCTPARFRRNTFFPA